MAFLRSRGFTPPWTAGEGMMSYPNWWGSPNKAVQMPSVRLIAHGISGLGVTSELRIALTTRNPCDLVKSVCDKRNFAKSAGGCASEVAMLVLGAGALAMQLESLPPPPAAKCEHFGFDALQKHDSPTLSRLGRFTRLDDIESLAKRVARLHPSSSSAGHAADADRAGDAERSALVADVETAQQGLVAACARHALRAPARRRRAP